MNSTQPNAQTQHEHKSNTQLITQIKHVINMNGNEI
jgi:hypothetical protein